MLRNVWGLLILSKRLMSTLPPRFSSLKVTHRGSESQVLLVEMNRPDTFNTLCPKMVEELAEAVEYFEEDSSIRCLVLTGTTKAFSGKSRNMILFFIL